MPITDALPDMKRELRFFPARTENPKSLSRKQVDFFNANGFLCPLDVFTPQEAEANRLYFEDLMVRAEKEGYNSYSINGWQRHCEGIYNLAMNKRILDYAEDLVGETLICEMTHYFCKMPGDVQRVSWHQDASYWPLTPSKVVTIWLAIDDVDAENGPMTVIPGSHLHGQIPFENSTKSERNVLGQTVHDPHRWGGDPVSYTMKAGQISMHHRPVAARVRAERIQSPALRPDDTIPAARRAGPLPGVSPGFNLPRRRSLGLLETHTPAEWQSYSSTE